MGMSGLREVGSSLRRDKTTEKGSIVEDSLWLKPKWNNAGGDQRFPQVHREATLKQVPCIRYPTTFRENLCRLYSTQEVNP